MVTDHQTHGYYVPPYSGWPILAAIGLFLLGLGSVDYFGESAAGGHILLAGIAVLFLVAIGWFTAVIRESQAGLYDAQMHRTFVWGMLWFIFTDVMLFASLIGALWYYRIFNLPQLGGNTSRFLTHFLLWPNFAAQWPVLANPDVSQFTGPRQGLTFTWQALITSCILLASAVVLFVAHRAIYQNKLKRLSIALSIALILAVLFIGLNIQVLYVAIGRFGITLSSGIYGSVVVFMLAIYLLHLIIATLLLLVVAGRSWLHHFSHENTFSVRAISWFWYFLTVTWIAIFISIY